MKRFSSGTFLVVATVVAGLTLAVFGVLKLRSWNRPAPSFANLTITKLTTAANVVTAAIAPNGDEFAFVSTDGTRQSLQLGTLKSTTTATEIIGPSEVVYHGLTFSPDGSTIFFVRSSGSDSPALYRVPRRGGSPTLVYKNVSGPVTISADGRSLAYVRDYPDQQQSAVVVGQADGSNERVAAVLKGPGETFVVDSGPAFSPNGKLVAVAAKHSDAGGSYENVMVVNVTNGTVRPIGESRFQQVGRISWYSFGGSMVIIGAKDPGPGQVWQLSYPAGELTRVVNDSHDYQSATTTRDSQVILAVQVARPGHQQGDLVLLKGPGQ